MKTRLNQVIGCPIFKGLCTIWIQIYLWARKTYNLVSPTTKIWKHFVHLISKLCQWNITTPKNHKSTGTDGVLNKMIKIARKEIFPVLTKVFNLIYLTGIFPEDWAISMIKPLFKGGNPFDPSDYRGISLTSCLGKLFCSILNSRIVTYLEENNIYTLQQIRKKSRTSDHIFVLQTLINKYTSPKFRVSKVTKTYTFALWT